MYGSSSTTSADGNVASALFAQIGAMLSHHDLEPSPTHYSLCHRYLSDPLSEAARDIDRLIARFGSLTPAALAEMRDPDGPAMSADTLNTLADDAAAYLQRVTGIVTDNGQAVQAYGDALAGNAAALDTPGRNDAALNGLILLTRRMIDHSRDAGDALLRSGLELDSLRTKLVEARHVADSDPLTGLPNRRALDRRIDDACRAARTNGTPLAIAICDIDHFKQVNDTHGHLVGDEVIKLVAAALGQAGDAFVSRYGGEEFVVLFDNVTLADAAARVDAIRRTVAARDIKIAATARRLGRVTFSAGVATLHANGTGSAMLKRADKALYRAKNDGRDRVLMENENEND